MQQTHKNTNLGGTLPNNTCLTRKPAPCPFTVVLTSLNIILQIAASAHLLRWPIIMNMKHLTI